ncbi:MAG: Hsp20/alpha crystallin family protein [Phycisphaera sp.]|nr:MAG: Hsp20/alpha crystallin family protein [Phycisphaera sp.]
MALSLWKHRDTANGSLGRLRDEIDHTFGRLMADPLDLIEPKLLRENGWIPPLDISESDAEFTVRAEVPGITCEDLDVSVTGHTLAISGEKEEIDEKKGENFYRSERRFGSFRRVIDLPAGVDADRVSADVDSGVLTVRVPKQPGAKRQQVEIKDANRKDKVAT